MGRFYVRSQGRAAADRYDPGPLDWVWIVLALGGGFVLLDKGSDWLVGGGARVARRLGMSTVVVGLTVVAWGTSAPEVVVSTVAAAQGHPSLAFGNVLGSNVANIGLVLGVCGLILPRVTEARLHVREAAWLVGSLALLWLVLRDRAIDRLDAALLLGAFGVHTVHAWSSGRGAAGEPAVEGERNPVHAIVAGMVTIALGAYLVTTGAIGGAERLGVPEHVIGFTIVALGTSLPELAAGARAAIRGEADMAVGNVVGSNVFNTLAVFGIVCLVAPIDRPEAGTPIAATMTRVLEVELFVVLAFSLAAILAPLVGGPRFARARAGILLGAYVGYSWWLFATQHAGTS